MRLEVSKPDLPFLYWVKTSRICYLYIVTDRWGDLLSHAASKRNSATTLIPLSTVTSFKNGCFPDAQTIILCWKWSWFPTVFPCYRGWLLVFHFIMHFIYHAIMLRSYCGDRIRERGRERETRKKEYFTSATCKKFSWFACFITLTKTTECTNYSILKPALNIFPLKSTDTFVDLDVKCDSSHLTA